MIPLQHPIPEEYVPVSQRVTPSGIEIVFCVKPKRQYFVNGVAVPSVTEVLEILDKPALPWWGMTIGVKGVSKLLNLADENGIPALRFAQQDDLMRFAMNRLGQWDFASDEDIVELLKSYKLTTNHVKEEAATRGLTVHDAFEAWGVTGELPDPEKLDDDGDPLFLADEKAYVTALRSFLEVAGDSLETVEQEVVVASSEYGFAGRFDWLGKCTKDFKAITKVYPKAKPKQILFPAGSCLLDLKTSKDVYISHAAQLAAYGRGLVESGYEHPENRAVIQVGKDGRYQLRIVNVAFEDTYAKILGAYHAVNLLEGGIKV